MDKQNLDNLRHSCAHLLAAAVLEYYPNAKLTLGPSIENGFYYDIDFGVDIVSEVDFPKIEQKMHELVKKWKGFEKSELEKKEALKMFAGNEYKEELINKIVERKEKITVYKSGDFFDLCRGGHVVHPKGVLKHFKLLSLAGAYWRGDEKNKMLTRIYGTVFPKKEELEKYLWQQEEGRKRDHKKLGKSLGLYLIDDQVGQGLIIWKPNGAMIRRQMEEFIMKEQIKRGYKIVYSPHIGKKQLWVTSGHWDLYRDKMYSPMKIDDVEYMVKPMNCPMHMMVYQSDPHSYRDLPLRISENASVYRYEQAGELSGMARGRHFSQDDAHIFCTESQVTEEFINVMDYAFYFLKAFGIKDYYMQLSVRDPKKKDKYLGSDKIWENAENKIKEAVKTKNVLVKVKEGEAAFYGPKLDFMIKDALGREWQCGTIQIDFSLPERFKLEYIDEKGEIKRPVVIHRAIAGSLERFFAILVEHYAGAFPLWLSPIQVVVLPISEKFLDYAQKVKKQLDKNNIRNAIDLNNKSLGAKIRQSTLQKVPYMIIIGEKETKSDVGAMRESPKMISVRMRDGKNLGMLEINKFIDQLKSQIENFS